MATKTRTRNIYLGDSFKIRYLCWKNEKVQQARSQFGGTEANIARTPLTPSSAEVRLTNFETSQQIPLGENGELEAVATISNNVIEYLIDPALLSAEGSYRAYTQIVLPDGQVTTEVVQFRVMART